MPAARDPVFADPLENISEHRLRRLPHSVRPPEVNYSINIAVRMEGRIITKWSLGSGKIIEGVHQSEALVVHFSDRSLMDIKAGSSARNPSDK
jgi:hypothetical protein